MKNISQEEVKEFYQLVKDYVKEVDNSNIDYIRINDDGMIKGIYNRGYNYDDDEYYVDPECLTQEFIRELREARLAREEAERIRKEKEAEERRRLYELERQAEMEKNRREWEAREAIERPIREARQKELRRQQYLKLKEEFGNE